jgi:hypothetical protein
MMLNEKWGTQQLYQKHQEKAVQPLVHWAKQVAAEWQYLFAESNMLILEASNFTQGLLNTNKVIVSEWNVVFDFGETAFGGDTNIYTMMVNTLFKS